MWYNTARWRETRQRIKLRDLYTCQRCGLTSAAQGALSVDHIIPHDGDEAKFWCDDTGLKTLCKSCHDGDKQSREKGGFGRAVFTQDGRVVW